MTEGQNPEASGRVHRPGMEAKARPTATEEVEAPPRGTAHISGSRRSTVGQQRRGEGHLPCGLDPQEQLRQRQREGSTDPGGDDNHHAHPQNARTQPRADPRGCLEILCPPRKTSTFVDKNHGNRLNGY